MPPPFITASVPPLDEVFSMAGMSLPAMLGKREAAPAAEVPQE